MLIKTLTVRGSVAEPTPALTKTQMAGGFAEGHTLERTKILTAHGFVGELTPVRIKTQTGPGFVEESTQELIKIRMGLGSVVAPIQVHIKIQTERGFARKHPGRQVEEDLQMAKLDDRIKTEVESLVQKGQVFLRRAQSLSREMEGDELADVASWVTRLGQMVRRLYGESSQHFKTYSTALATSNFYSLHSNWNAHFAQVVGVAKTIKHDLESGLLTDFKAIVQADIFADFLEMGEYLLQEGYKDAAAVIIGSVLEDGLRKLSERHGLPVINESGKSLTIDPLNNQLAKQEVYSKLTQKQITTWAHIRNKAAHGEFSEYNREQVQMMLLFVQGFALEHLNCT